MGSVTYATDLRSLTDAELAAATNRAYREAARCWGEYRREAKDSPVKAMLLTSADAAEEWWQTLRDEQAARLSRDEAVEVRSDDGYAVQPDEFPLPDGGRTTLAPDEPPTLHRDFVSPWVRNAETKSLPYRVEGGAARDDEAVAR